MTFSTFPSSTALPGVTYPVKRTPRWSSVPADAVAGLRTRFQLWTYPTYSYELVFSVLRAANAYQELQTLVGFWNQMGGPERVFQFHDVTDDTATAQAFGTGDGASTQFQLARTLGGFTEPVFVTSGTPAVFKNAVLLATPADYSISAYGVVTFVAAPAVAAALTWTGTYNWPCRFDDSGIEFEEFMNLLHEIKSLRFSSEKLP